MSYPKYATHLGYSDRHAFEVVKVVSEKTLEIRRLKAERDPSWKPEYVPGGFSAVCTNMYEQKWLFESDPSAEVIRIRKKKGHNDLWIRKGFNYRLTEEPVEFYDYNF